MEDLTPSETESSRQASEKGDYEEDMSLSDLSSIDSNEDNNDQGQEGGKIPKPHGEAGRPNSGGYNLKESLGWTKTDFEKIQVRTSTTACGED
jgi:hypothetical protein